MAAATRGKRREVGKARLASAQLPPAGPSSLQVRGGGEAREEGMGVMLRFTSKRLEALLIAL